MTDLITRLEAAAEGSRELDRQREWVMDYMFRNSVGSVARNYDTGTTYDCGADFCDAFLERFPGRKPDPNLVNASRRLAKLLRDMWRDRLVARGIIGNEKYLPQEPSWRYVYSLPAREHIRRRDALKALRALTPAKEGSEDHGV